MRFHPHSQSETLAHIFESVQRTHLKVVEAHHGKELIAMDNLLAHTMEVLMFFGQVLDALFEICRQGIRQCRIMLGQSNQKDPVVLIEPVFPDRQESLSQSQEGHQYQRVLSISQWLSHYQISGSRWQQKYFHLPQLFHDRGLEFQQQNFPQQLLHCGS